MALPLEPGEAISIESNGLIPAPFPHTVLFLVRKALHVGWCEVGQTK